MYYRRSQQILKNETISESDLCTISYTSSSVSINLFRPTCPSPKKLSPSPIIVATKTRAFGVHYSTVAEGMTENVLS